MTPTNMTSSLSRYRAKGTIANFALGAALIAWSTASLAATGAMTEFPLPTATSVPQGIAAGSDGNLWVVENGANKIARITTKGVIKEFPLPAGATRPYGIAAAPDGNLWFTHGNGVSRITPAGVVTVFPISGGGIPHEIVAGPDGNMWFTEWFRDLIGRVTPAGVITLFPTPTRLSDPESIAAGPDGNLWFTESNPGAHKIGRITPAGVITEFNVATTGALKGIAAGPDGNLWFTEDNLTGTPDKIGRITPAGAITRFPLPMTTDPQPRRIIAGPDGNLWYSEGSSGANKISRITTAGVVTQFQIPTLFNPAWGLTVGPDGNIWAGAPRGNVIRVQAVAANTTYALHLPSGFVTKTKAVGQGQSLVWVNEVAGLSRVQHSLATPVFDSLPKGTGSLFTFKFAVAGTYAYKDPLHATHTGTVTVAPKVAPATGTLTTPYTVTWATGTGAVVPAGWVMDVQMKTPTGVFANWQTGVATKSAPFTPAAGLGVYRFQARMRNLANGLATGYSPAASLTVN